LERENFNTRGPPAVVFENVFVNFGEVDIGGFEIDDADDLRVDGFFFKKKFNILVNFGGSAEILLEKFAADFLGFVLSWARDVDIDWVMVFHRVILDYRITCGEKHKTYLPFVIYVSWLVLDG